MDTTLVIVYIILGFATAVFTAIAITGDKQEDIVRILIGGLWGIGVGAFWPLFWAIAFIGLIAQCFVKSPKKRR